MNLYNFYQFCNNKFVFAFMFFSSLISFCYISMFFECHKKNKTIDFISNTIFNGLSFSIKKILAIIVHLFVIFLLIFSNNYFIISGFGCEDIRVMPKGTYCYYTIATNEKGQTYTLPAKIEKGNTKNYCVENVYFKNGGYLYFDNYDYFKYDESQSVYDQDSREWEIELTNIKTSHYMVDETELKWSLNEIIHIIAILSHIFTIALHILHWKNYNNKTQLE